VNRYVRLLDGSLAFLVDGSSYYDFHKGEWRALIKGTYAPCFTVFDRKTIPHEKRVVFQDRDTHIDLAVYR
tara:strand:+ start:567 stop:779 length:213 start_codon:yes stop_codon:yes gene_type:complete